MNPAGRGRRTRIWGAGAEEAGGSRRRILDAASAVFAANPGASLREVADAAGVGRATVHRHFPGREDLVREIAFRAMEEAAAGMDRACLEEGPVEEAVGRLAEALVPMGHRFHFLLAEGQLYSDPEYLAAEEKLVGRLERLAERGRREGAFGADVPPAWVVDAIGALVYAAWEGVSHGRVAALDAPRLVSDTLLSGLRGRKL